MPAILIALIEALVTSPVVQEQAWSVIKPHLEAGTLPTDAEMVQAYGFALAAHRAVHTK